MNGEVYREVSLCGGKKNGATRGRNPFNLLEAASKKKHRNRTQTIVNTWGKNQKKKAG